MSKIQSVKAREILDSRGNPTVEVEIKTDVGECVSSVPSGASTGKHEAKELRDGGKRFMGKGVLKAVDNVNKMIGPKLVGKDPLKQKEIDDLIIEIDGTKDKSNLGANATTPVSMAVARSAALSEKMHLFEYIEKISGQKKKIPNPSFNILNGGAHAGNDLDIQEFMIVCQSEKYSDKLRMASEIYHQLKEILKEKYSKLATNIGDEGGFAPPLDDPKKALDLIMEAAEKLKYEKKVNIILDVAASQFFKGGNYKMKIGEFDDWGLLRYYVQLIDTYPVMGIEDPFAENDWDGFSKITTRIADKITVIGDDLLVTNPERIKEAQKKLACNGLLLKINQIGTVSEAVEAAKLAREYNWKIMVSHRSGETTDDFIADFSVGIGADFIKTGAPARGERLAKYNRLLKIETLL